MLRGQTDMEEYIYSIYLCLNGFRDTVVGPMSVKYSKVHRSTLYFWYFLFVKTKSKKRNLHNINKEKEKMS